MCNYDDQATCELYSNIIAKQQVEEEKKKKEIQDRLNRGMERKDD